MEGGHRKPAAPRRRPPVPGRRPRGPSRAGGAGPARRARGARSGRAGERPRRPVVGVPDVAGQLARRPSRTSPRAGRRRRPRSSVTRSASCTPSLPSGSRFCRACSTATATTRGWRGRSRRRVRSEWDRIRAAGDVLTHTDYWSGNVVWRDGELTGIVDWSGGVARAARLRRRLVPPRPRAALQTSGLPTCSWRPTRSGSEKRFRTWLSWDTWAAARSHDQVETWVPNYAPLGRPDLTADELRRRHERWTARLIEGA